jgi:hypothetical protein
MADFGISDFELLDFITMVLISLLIGYWWMIVNAYHQITMKLYMTLAVMFALKLMLFMQEP